jgi:hypothetical protein
MDCWRREIASFASVIEGGIIRVHAVRNSIEGINTGHYRADPVK